MQYLRSVIRPDAWSIVEVPFIVETAVSLLSSYEAFVVRRQMAGPDRVFQQRDNGPRTDVVDGTNCFLELRDRRTDGPGPQKHEETSAVCSCTTVCLIHGVVSSGANL